MSYSGPDRRRFNWYPLFGYIVLMLAVVGAVYMVQDAAIQRERKAQLFQCERVQLLRDQSNGTNFLIFDYFDEAAKAQQAAGKVENDPEQKEIRLETAARLRAAADMTVVTGPTDCHKAVNSPETYIAPSPSFVSDGGKVVAIAKERANEITRKASEDEPLFAPIP